MQTGLQKQYDSATDRPCVQCSYIALVRKIASMFTTDCTPLLPPDVLRKPTSLVSNGLGCEVANTVCW